MLPHQFRDGAPYQLRSSYEMRTPPLSLGSVILLEEKGEWESNSRKTRGPQVAGGNKLLVADIFFFSSVYETGSA